MELTGINQIVCFLVFSQLVIECNTFNAQVVTLFYHVGMRFQEVQTLAVRITQFLVKLVKFHQDTCIGSIQIVRFFQCGQRFLRILLFVVISQ